MPPLRSVILIEIIEYQLTLRMNVLSEQNIPRANK